LDAYDPETVILMSPHAPAASDVLLVDGSERFSGSLAQFGDATQYTWPGDPEFADALLVELAALDIPAMARSEDARLCAGWLDHATIVPLSFLDPNRTRRLVILSLTYHTLDEHWVFGKAARLAAEKLDRKVAFVASGDCSHRLTREASAGYSPRGAEFDDWLKHIVEGGHLHDLVDVDRTLDEAAGECGLRSFVALGGFVGEDTVATRVLSYQGPWGVGYLTALVGDAALAAADGAGPENASTKADVTHSEIVTLARQAIEAYVLDGTIITPEPLTGAQYPARAGAFVSLHLRGALRGCVGTIAPTADTLAEEVVFNAIEAAARDPRFPSVKKPELAGLEIKVDVLQPPECCNLEDLDPEHYGVIVSSGPRRGLLLPDLDGVDDVATQVDIAMRKGGIAPDECCAIERFKVDRYT
jgi:AmmeMemoRadiSam system protein A